MSDDEKINKDQDDCENRMTFGFARNSKDFNNNKEVIDQKIQNKSLRNETLNQSDINLSLKLIDNNKSKINESD